MDAGEAPLAGIRVLDLASLYAAPLVATLLADHGAEVVKVEPPAGDGYRDWPAMWALVGRGKRSLTLDLALPRGRELLMGLVPGFDIVIENFPTRLAEQRGLTARALRSVHPALVVVSASGFGSDGPYADRPANGTIGEAFAGLTHLTGEGGGAPMLPSVPLGDVIAGAFGAMGAVMALVRQIRTGRGGHVDLTVFEPILHALGPALSGFDRGAAPPTRDGGAMGVPLRGTFQTLDGKWVAISCSTTRHVQVVADLAGTQQGPQLRARVVEWIGGRERAEVLDALVGGRVPATAVNDLREVTDDPHVAARGSLRRVGDRVVATPTPRIDGLMALAPTPALGDANRNLLEGVLGLDSGELDELARAGVIHPPPP
jgi:crotonobetainyl-CoA:carnitine CoA-transferase CaiB-like acyl-CoA transferase